MFEDGKRHALLKVALCGATATFPDSAGAEDCEPCTTALAALPKERPEPRIVTMEQVYQAWHATSEEWGGCADREAIRRIMDLFTGQLRPEEEPVLTTGATPFDVCCCLRCGPPFRAEVPNWRDSPFGGMASWMPLCPTCGSKRCPGAIDHRDHPKVEKVADCARCYWNDHGLGREAHVDGAGRVLS